MFIELALKTFSILDFSSLQNENYINIKLGVKENMVHSTLYKP